MEGAKAIASQLPEEFQWHRTYCDFSAGKFFCEWECPSEEALEQAFNAAEVPFEDIHSVRLFDATTGEWADE